MKFTHIKGSGKVGNKLVSLKPMQTLIVEGSIKVDIRFGKETTANISADDNILDLINVEQVGDDVTIGIKPNCSITTTLPIRVVLYVPTSLKEINLQGSGSINATGNTCNILATIELTGSGSIVVDELNTTYLSVLLSGSGTIVLQKGQTDTLHASISGSGKITTEAMFSNNVVVNLAGSGTAKIHASKTISSIISGSGNIKIIGNAKSIREKITGSGKLQYA